MTTDTPFTGYFAMKDQIDALKAENARLRQGLETIKARMELIETPGALEPGSDLWLVQIWVEDALNLDDRKTLRDYIKEG